jgi:hypothetical protein
LGLGALGQIPNPQSPISFHSKKSQTTNILISNNFLIIIKIWQ